MCRSIVDIQSAAAEIRQEEKELECGSLPNLMVDLPNIGGALCSTPHVWLTPATRVPCSNAAKARNPLKLAGVPQTTGQFSAASGPKFTILWGHLEEILLLNKFFSLSICALVANRYSPTKLHDGAQMVIFLGPAFPASRMQHISDLHSKFALGPHHVSKYSRLPMYSH